MIAAEHKAVWTRYTTTCQVQKNGRAAAQERKKTGFINTHSRRSSTTIQEKPKRLFNRASVIVHAIIVLSHFMHNTKTKTNREREKDKEKHTTKHTSRLWYKVTFTCVCRAVRYMRVTRQRAVTRLTSSTPVLAQATSTVPSPKSAKSFARPSWFSLPAPPPPPPPPRRVKALAVAELCPTGAPAIPPAILPAIPPAVHPPPPLLLLLLLVVVLQSGCT